MSTQRLTPAEVAAELGITETTLRTWRYRNKGPDYCQPSGRLVFYLRSDVDAYRTCLR